MFKPYKVTPIEEKDGKIIECQQQIIDLGDVIGFDEVIINGNTYVRLEFLDYRTVSDISAFDLSFSDMGKIADGNDDYSIIIKESKKEIQSQLTGG